MEDLKEKIANSIRRKIMVLSLGGACMAFLCILCVFMFSIFSINETLSDLLPQLKDKLSEEIAGHTSESKMQLYENHVIADASTLELNFKKPMDDCDLLAETMSLYVNNPERYISRNVSTDNVSHDNKFFYTDYSNGVNLNSLAVKKDVTAVNNMKDLLRIVASQYEKLPLCFYVISKSGYCLSINSNVLSYAGKQFSFLSLNQDRRNFDSRGLPAYTIHDNSNVKVGHGLITDVFYNNGEPVVSYSTPFFDRKGFAGVVAFDISLTDLVRFSYRADEDHEWKFFFMDKSGKIKMSSFEEGIFSVSAAPSLKQIASVDIKELVSNMNNDRSGISRIRMDGTSYYVAFSPVPSLNCYLADVFFEDDIKEALKSSSEQLFGLLTEKNEQIFKIIGRYRIMSGVFLTLILLISLTIAYRIVKKYTSPIERISQEIKSLATGDFEKRICVNSGDEIEDLAENINNMVVEIKKKIDSISKVTSEKAQMEATMSVAKTIQSNMLPKKFDISNSHDNFDLFAMNLPAKSVSGDFYDLFMVDDDRIIVTIADVSGKGIPAALFMVTSMTILKNLSHMMLKDNNDLANVVSQTNLQLCDNNKEGMFVTLFTAVINLKTREMTYVSGGHNPPLLMIKKSSEFKYLKAPKIFPMLGVSDLIEYEQNTIRLDEGACLFLYTDGVTEAIDVNEMLFGENRLLYVMNEEMKTAKPEKVIKGVYNRILEFAGEAEQFDDITMLCFRFK